MVVGAVFVALVLSAAGLLLWLARYGESGSSAYYLVYFKEHSLAGLQRDSVVTMRGIPVGQVERMAIAEHNVELVEVLLRVKRDIPVRQNTRAVIQRNLLTGLAAVDLVGTTQEAPPLDGPQPGREFPVIPEGQSRIQAIQESVPQMLHTTGEVMRQLQALLSQENREMFARLLGQLAELVTELNQRASQLGQVLESVGKSSQSAEALLRVAREELTETLDEVQRSAITFSRELRELSHTLQTSAQRVSESFERLERPRDALLGPLDEALGPGEERR